MKIGAVGGLGLDKEITGRLKSYPLILIGSDYDLCREKFSPPRHVEFYPDYLAPSYETHLSSCDFLFEVSNNLKSKYLLNDIAVKHQKPYAAVLYREGEWGVFRFYPGSACLHCLSDYEKPEPPFLRKKIPAGPLIDLIEKSLEILISGSCFITTEGKEIQVQKNPDCPVCGGKYAFLNNEKSDVVSVSCGDVTVSVTPMNTVQLDLKAFREILPNENRVVKESAFFLEFKADKYSMVLFRQGRAVMKGTKEKNTGLTLYRELIGS